MPGNFTKTRTVISSDRLTASLWNTEFDNIITNFTPDGLDDASTDASAMQATADPYPLSAESLPTSARGEFQRLRYQLLEFLKRFGATQSETKWYADVPYIYGVKGSDVASAAALTLPADGNFFVVTGTTAITSIGTKGVGGVVYLKFSGSLTLTHHSSDLILPGGADIVTAAGDIGVFIEYAAGDWQCVAYASRPVRASSEVKNLVIDCSADASLTVTADSAVLLDSGNNAVRHTSVSVAANITSSGAAGLDTGTEASSTWYYVWLISNSTTISALLSTSASSPTMPSGYTFKKLVGAVKNDSSSNFNKFRQNGNVVIYATIESGLTKSDTGAGVAQTDQSLSASLPSISQTAIFSCELTGTWSDAGTKDLILRVGPAGFSSGSAQPVWVFNNTVYQNASTITEGGNATVNTDSAQRVDYYFDLTSTNRTSYTLTMNVCGYIVNVL